MKTAHLFTLLAMAPLFGATSAAAQEPPIDDATPSHAEVDAEVDADVAEAEAEVTEDAAPTVETAAEVAAEREAALPLRTEHRARPDYDGRADPGPDAGEVLLWIPRVIFAPLTLVLDYGIRRPLGWFVTTAERERWDVFLIDMFTWNERRSGLVPTGFVAYGMQPSVGLYFWSNDDIAPGHQIRLNADFGGVDYITGSAAYRILAHDAVMVSVLGDGGTRPDRVFSGIGWDAVSNQYRFRETWVRGAARLQIEPWRESRITVTAGVDARGFDPNGFAWLSNNAPPLSQALDANVFETPAGLERGYTAYRQRLDVAIDSREEEPAPGHGVRLEGHAELAFDVERPNESRWFRYGGAVGGFLDLGGHRVLGLWGLAHFVDPLMNEPVPFTELVEFGGTTDILLSGFLRGQLRGRSGTALTLEYRYPIWTRLDGRLHAGIGNVFDAHLGDFDIERLRASFGFGVATVGEPDSRFELAIAAATSPFVHGVTIDSVQLLVGSRQGF